MQFLGYSHLEDRLRRIQQISITQQTSNINNNFGFPTNCKQTQLGVLSCIGVPVIAI